MIHQSPNAAVAEILTQFAQRTGLVGDAPPRRYLWTDAFAVCTLLALHRHERGTHWLDLARALVDQVHATLGRHRADDARRGWISGLDEDEGAAHPTHGGLRIGKPLPERRPGEPFDEQLEWERDGQYFHYLTKWMHALAALWQASGGEQPLRWAIELAQAADAGFAQGPPGEAPRMIWKASIDLSRPQVPSMGAHDPLDGLVTFRALRAAAVTAGWTPGDVGLDGAIARMRALCAHARWATGDTLGTGGLLADALQLARLVHPGDVDAALLPRLIDSASLGLLGILRSGALSRPASERLAFRELGLTIGLHAVPRLARLAEARRGELDDLEPHLEPLIPYVALAKAVEGFWLEPASQRGETWREHLDINAVMLATSLLPEGFLAS